MATAAVARHQRRSPAGRARGTRQSRRAAAAGWEVGLARRTVSCAEVTKPQPRESDDVILMRQWLSSSLELYAYISAPVSGEEGNFSHMFFQVLSLERRPLYVRTFKAAEEESAGDALHTMTAQPLARSRAPITDAEAGPGAEAEVFTYVDPTDIDILGVCGGGKDSRCHWHRWKPEESDLAGCVALRAPEVLGPKVPLGSPSVPTLCLWDALVAAGFESVEAKVSHSLGSPKVFDNRALAGKRAYLQCLLILGELLSGGVAFSPGRADVFYQFLLKIRRLPPPNASAKTLRLMLAGAEGDTVSSAVLALSAPGASSPRGVKRHAPKPIEDGVEDLAAVGDDSTEDEPAPGPELPRVVEQGQVEDLVVGDDDDENLAQSSGNAARPPAPNEILGTAVAFIRGRADDSWHYKDRLSVKCPNAAHGRCNKSRSLALDVEVFGPRAAEAYLGAWLQKADMPEGAHARYKPTRAEMRAYLEQH